MPKINIREAQITDLDDLLMLYSVLYGSIVLKRDKEMDKIWSHMLTDQYYHIIVAEEDGKIVSTCTCVIIQNITFEHRPYAIIDNIVRRLCAWGFISIRETKTSDKSGMMIILIKFVIMNMN